ncbi:hypothetical protein NHX12_021577, partial [Muraenolepis orangiensis]
MTQRHLLQAFEEYEEARLLFVQTVADLATEPQSLQQADVMSLLRPLLSDPVPIIQLKVALAISRLADRSEGMAEAVVQGDILPQLVNFVASQNISKHSVDLAELVVEAEVFPAALAAGLSFNQFPFCALLCVSSRGSIVHAVP